uniref:Uncharacterized protein n=1 Tax=Oryza nivara TaxID=4536 RepID=A0A0E0IXX0_ORYNI
MSIVNTDTENHRHQKHQHRHRECHTNTDTGSEEFPAAIGWRCRCGGGREDDNDDEEGGAYGGNGKGEQAFVVLMVSSAAASASTSATVSGSVPVGLAGAQDLNLAFPHHHGRALQSLEFTVFPSLESSSMCNPGGNLAAANDVGGRGSC